MNETLKLGLVLFIITVVSASILAISNDVTSIRIEEADRRANDLAKQEVLERAHSFKIMDKGRTKEIVGNNLNIMEINECYNDDNLMGYTFKTKIKGYGGEIELMVGISNDGKVEGIKVLSHGETPGLGANATKAYFTDSFKNKSIGEKLVGAKDPKENNEVQALTSATITTNAVVDGVNEIIEIYNSQLANQAN